MAEGTQKPDEGARSFTRMLDQLQHGEAVLEVSEEFQGLCADIRDTALKKEAEVNGTYTLIVSVKANARGEVAVGFKHKTSIKKPVAAPSHAWFTKGANLTFSNPRQEVIPAVRDATPKRRLADEDDDEDEGNVG